MRVQVETSDLRPPIHDVPLHVANVLNTPTYGAGLRFAPKARIDDGLLNVTLLEDLNIARILRLLPGLLLGGKIKTDRAMRFSTTHIRLTPDRLCTFHGDGELFGPAPVEISVLPKALSVLVPRTHPS